MSIYRQFRPTHLARSHGFQGTDSYPSHGPGLAPKPSNGTTSAPAKQQALKRRWTFDEIHYGSVAGRLLDHRQMGQRISSWETV